MVVRGPSLSQVTRVRQYFIKNSNIAFHENPINPIVTVALSPKPGGGEVSPLKEFLFVRKQHFKM
jgi:hypothetical protein